MHFSIYGSLAVFDAFTLCRFIQSPWYDSRKRDFHSSDVLLSTFLGSFRCYETFFIFETRTNVLMLRPLHWLVPEYWNQSGLLTRSLSLVPSRWVTRSLILILSTNLISFICFDTFQHTELVPAFLIPGLLSMTHSNGLGFIQNPRRNVQIYVTRIVYSFL